MLCYADLCVRSPKLVCSLNTQVPFRTHKCTLMLTIALYAGVDGAAIVVKKDNQGIFQQFVFLQMELGILGLKNLAQSQLRTVKLV